MFDFIVKDEETAKKFYLSMAIVVICSALLFRRDSPIVSWMCMLTLLFALASYYIVAKVDFQVAWFTGLFAVIFLAMTVIVAYGTSTTYAFAMTVLSTGCLLIKSKPTWYGQKFLWIFIGILLVTLGLFVISLKTYLQGQSL